MGEAAVTNVAALTHGRDLPSARFRVRQYLDRLDALDVHVREFPAPVPAPADNPLYRRLNRLPALRAASSAAWAGVKVLSRAPAVLTSRRWPITWLTREILPGYYTLERVLKQPMVLDVDDAIWLRPPHGEDAARRAAQRASVVVAGNDYLADWFSPFTERVEVVPTAIDTAHFRPRATVDGMADRPFTVGWTGTFRNYRYLYRIEPALAAFLHQRNAQLLVVGDREPEFTRLTREQVRFVRWSPDVEVAAVQAMDVGIMPLADTPWERGKCGFKLIQYLACGVPVVASPVGANADIVRGEHIGFLPRHDAEWVDALETLQAEPERRERMGEKGRRLAVDEYSTAVMAPRLARLFKALV